MWLVTAEVANFLEVREAVTIHVSSKSPSLMCATLVYYWTKVGLSSPFAVPRHPRESLVDFSGVPISTNTTRSRVRQELDALLEAFVDRGSSSKVGL